jgi:hydroxymethylglutaryl-CoA lyase
MADKVTICEMAPRDGMQILNRSARIPKEMRLALLKALQRAGMPYIEAGSFVNPKVLRQLADTDELLRGLDTKSYRGKLAVLVPNLKYYLLHQDVPNLNTVAIFLSASEDYSRKNKRVSIEEDLAEAEKIAELAKHNNHGLRAHLSAAFRDLSPDNLHTDPRIVVRIAKRLLDMGCEMVALADTDGNAMPKDIQATIQYLIDAGIEVSRLGVHLHDRGQATANAWKAYELGIRSFDSAVGGIGGNQAVKESVGNIATEQLVFLFGQSGIETGIDHAALKEALLIVYSMTLYVGDPRPSTREMDDLLRSGGLADSSDPYCDMNEFAARLPDDFDLSEHIGSEPDTALVRAIRGQRAR